MATYDLKYSQWVTLPPTYQPTYLSFSITQVQALFLSKTSNHTIPAEYYLSQTHYSSITIIITHTPTFSM